MSLWSAACYSLHDYCGVVMLCCGAAVQLVFFCCDAATCNAAMLCWCYLSCWYAFMLVCWCASMLIYYYADIMVCCWYLLAAMLCCAMQLVSYGAAGGSATAYSCVALSAMLCDTPLCFMCKVSYLVACYAVCVTLQCACVGSAVSR